MRKEAFTYAAVWWLILIGIQGCHRVDEGQAPASGSDKTEVRSVSKVDSSIGNTLGQGVRVPEPAPKAAQDIDDLWTLFPGEPERSFQKGREDFLNKKYRLAAQSIQQSTIYVKLQSLRALGTTKRALLDSEVALSNLAKDVEKGKMRSLARLDTSFAATERAVARLHYEKAKQAYAKGALGTTGVELQGARDSLGRAAAWTGDHVYLPLMHCLDRAGNDGKRLLAGSDRSPGETRKTLSDLGAQIDRLDKKAELEDTRGLFAGETDVYLQEALRRFKNRDRQGAAGNMRRAGACMAVEAFGSIGDAQGVLESEIEALRKTAQEVEKGSLTSPNKLRRRFASAQYALARVHHIRASRYNSQHYDKRAVSALSAAVANLERAVSWAGKEMKNSSARVVKDVRDMSKRMREDLSVEPDEISTAVSNLSKAIERLNGLAASP